MTEPTVKPCPNCGGDMDMTRAVWWTDSFAVCSEGCAIQVTENKQPPLQTYKLETLCPTSGDGEPMAAELSTVLGVYLLDLMRAHDYEVVGGVRYEVPEPEVTPYPAGWCVLRALVDVREFDEDFGNEEEDLDFLNIRDDLADDLRHCEKCGALCDHRVQVCMCGPDCPYPKVQ